MSTFQLAVNERRLLAEFPAFFHSFTEMLTELTQNVYRAGGTRMAVTINYDTHEILVSDDGPGVTDPAKLFTAGESGWDDNVVAPAGLGFFALLGMAEEVVITSHTKEGSWTATVTEACFEGEPIETEAVEPDRATGLFVYAKLKETVSAPISLRIEELPSQYQTSPGFRQFYPIDVELTTVKDGVAQQRLLPQPTVSGPAIDTTVGRIIRHGQHSPGLPTEVNWVWEHRLLTNTKSGRELMRALKAQPDGAFVADGLRGTDIWVWIDTATQAIRPKLPDRREVIDDAGYHATLTELAKEIVKAARVDAIRAQLSALDLPDVITDLADVGEALAALALPDFFDWPASTLLELAGYHVCTYVDYHHFNLYYIENDGWDRERYVKQVWARTALPVANDAIADVLCQEGIWAYEATNADAVQVRFVNYRGIDNAPFVLGFADAIVVERNGQTIGTLTRWLSDGDGIMTGLAFDGTTPENLPVCVWTREPRSVITDLHHAVPDDEMNALKMAMYTFDSGLFWDYIIPDTDEDIDEGAIATAVIEELVAAFAVDAMYEEKRWHAVNDLSEKRYKLQSAIRAMSRLVKASLEEHPELEALLEPTMALAQQWEDAPWDVQAFEPEIAKTAS